MRETLKPRSPCSDRREAEELGDGRPNRTDAPAAQGLGHGSLPSSAPDLLISLRKEIEALRLELRLARALLDSLPDALIALDLEGHILCANAAAATMLGLPQAELTDRTAAELLPGVWEHLLADHGGPIGEGGERDPLAGTWSLKSVEAEGQRLLVLVSRRGNLGSLGNAPSLDQLADGKHGAGTDLGILLHDAEGRILDADATAQALLGLPSDDGVACSALTTEWSLFDAQGRRIRTDDLPARVAFKTGRAACRMVGVLNHGRRDYRWLEITAIPLSSIGARTPSRIISIIHNRTEAERARELFAHIQRLMRIAGFEWWPHTGQVFLTRRWDEACGEESGRELAWNDFLSLFVEDDRARLAEAFSVCAQRSGDLSIECRLLDRDGRHRWVRILGVVHSLDGEALRLSGAIQDISEYKLREEELKIRSDTDRLTGFLTRNAILRFAAALAEQPNARFAILHVDLDRFKLVNDLFGHQVGDRVLAAAATRLRAAVSAKVQIGRLTGDEFLIVLPDELARRAETVAEVLVRAFEKPIRLPEHEILLSLSIGVARLPEDASDLHHLLMQADSALQEAKRRGRKGWVGASGALARERSERAAIEAHLRLALEREEFELVFQPQIELRSGRVVGAEALLRWHSPNLGSVPPDRFIVQAEASGEIVRIGRWVIDEACRRLAQWRRSGLGIERLSLNLSYRQLLSTRVADEILRALFAYELSGELLEVEITERVLTDELNDVRPILQALRAAGVSIAIDDFGEGYSALDRLRRLPIQTLKISHRFTAGVPQIAGDVAICQAILGVARGLGLEVIAEGLENEAQRSFMHRHGVRIAQGFLFARPLSAEEFVKFCRERGACA